MQKTRTRLSILLLVLLPWLLSVAAADGLFESETLVDDEGSETRNAALSEMLADVLVRVSGKPAIGTQAAAAEILQAAPTLVQQYRYRTARHAAAMQRYLWARFDPAAVQRMMRERKLPVWTQRPRVLMWVATERGGRREMLNFDAVAAARSAALQRAQQRGMPLQLPLMDLQDQTALQPADIWSNYEAAIDRASARYPHDLVVTGRLQAASDGSWRGSWSLRGGEQSFRTAAQALPDALASAVDQIQNLLAARYAPAAADSAARGTRVRFSEVQDLAAYGGLVSTLAGMPPVAGVALRHVEGDRYTFEFQLRGGDEALRRALDDAPGLRAEPGLMEPSAPEVDYHYRLLY